MAVVNYQYYTNEYLGNSVPSDDFPQLEKRAEEKLSYYERIYTVTYPDDNARKMAICALADNIYYYDCAENGLVFTSSSIGSVSSSMAGGSVDTSKGAQSRTMLNSLRVYADVYRGVGRCV